MSVNNVRLERGEQTIYKGGKRDGGWDFSLNGELDGRVPENEGF